jgi:hypothetical protein
MTDSKVSYEFYSVNKIILNHSTNYNIVKRLKQVFCIMISKGLPPFESEEGMNGWFKILQKNNMVALDVYKNEACANSYIYMAIENNEVKCCALLDNNRIDRIATKKGCEGKGYASNMLRELSSSLHNYCGGSTGLTAAVNKKVVRVFEKAGFMNMNDHPILSKCLIDEDENNVGMCPASQLEFYTKYKLHPDGGYTLTKEEFKKERAGWLKLEIETLRNKL